MVGVTVAVGVGVRVEPGAGVPVWTNRWRYCSSKQWTVGVTVAGH